MAMLLRRFYPCTSKCRGGRKCMCQSRHAAHCICGDPDCYCHKPAAYGLELDWKEMKYYPANRHRAEVKTLIVLGVR